MRLTVCWTKKGLQCRQEICRRFGIPLYLTVNHETPCDIREEDMELLRECERRGFLMIRFKKE